MLIKILRYSLQMSAKVSKKTRKTHDPPNKSPNANKFRKRRAQIFTECSQKEIRFKGWPFFKPNHMIEPAESLRFP